MFDKNVNWNDLPTIYKRGCCIRNEGRDEEIDKEMPIFTQNFDYVKDLLKYNLNIIVKIC